MRLNRWLVGLAPCIILLFILSLSVVDVEGRRSRKKKHRHRSRSRSHGRGPVTPLFPSRVPRHRPSPFDGIERPAEVHGPSGPHVGQSTDNVVAPITQACPSGDLKKNLTELWEEVHHLSNPIHIHVHGGKAGGGHTSHHSPGGKGHHSHTPGGKKHHHPHTPGGKGHPHPRTPGGKGHRHPHSPRAGKVKHTPGGKGPRQTKHRHHGSPSPHPHETHIHIHIDLILDTNDTDTDESEKPKPSDDYAYARCDLIAPEKGSPVKGTVLLRQKSDEPLEIKFNISGMAASKQTPDQKTSQHGFHVHEFADFTQGCASFGGHYNPENTTHGPHNGEDSHVGDWGNIDCDSEGNCVGTMNITDSDLKGPSSISGRGIVLHQDVDDLGQGGDKGSHTTGNAGKRLACCGIVRTGPPSDGDW